MGHQNVLLCRAPWILNPTLTWSQSNSWSNVHFLTFTQEYSGTDHPSQDKGRWDFPWWHAYHPDVMLGWCPIMRLVSWTKSRKTDMCPLYIVSLAAKVGWDHTRFVCYCILNLEDSLSMVKINVETLLDAYGFGPVHLDGEYRQLVCWMVVWPNIQSRDKQGWLSVYCMTQWAMWSSIKEGGHLSQFL
jgi:hypothetical protein